VTRSAVIITEQGKVALIMRVNAGQRYFLFPGGQIEEGESLEQAAAREAQEELGLEVAVGRLTAIVTFCGNEQYYYEATVTAGDFGTGNGEELAYDEHSATGSYTPVWLTLAEMGTHDVRPQCVVELLTNVHPHLSFPQIVHER
jgi:8-oxo-dGTP diphosphatase